MAPDLGVGAAPHPIDAAERDAAVARAPRLADRRDTDGEAQADLGPVDGLRRLRGGDELRGPARHGPQEVAEDVLPAQHEAGVPAERHHGRPDGEARRRRGPAQGRQRHAAQEPPAGQAPRPPQGLRGRRPPLQAERHQVWRRRGREGRVGGRGEGHQGGGSREVIVKDICAVWTRWR